MKRFVWLLLMDMFLCWKEYPGLDFFPTVGIIFLLIPKYKDESHLWMVFDFCIFTCRRDARKVAYLQHGILDSSMG